MMIRQSNKRLNKDCTDRLALCQDNVTEWDMHVILLVWLVSQWGNTIQVDLSVRCHKLVTVLLWPYKLLECQTPKTNQIKLATCSQSLGEFEGFRPQTWHIHFSCCPPVKYNLVLRFRSINFYIEWGYYIKDVAVLHKKWILLSAICGFFYVSEPINCGAAVCLDFTS